MWLIRIYRIPRDVWTLIFASKKGTNALIVESTQCIRFVLRTDDILITSLVEYRCVSKVGFGNRGMPLNIKNQNWNKTIFFFTRTVVVVVSNRFLSIDRPEFLWHSTQLLNSILFRIVNECATCRMFRHSFWNSSWKSHTRCTYSVAVTDDYNSRRLTI